MVRAKAFIFRHVFAGLPQTSDLELVEQDLPDVQNGEFLAEALYLSVDPYMRAYAQNLPLNTTFIGDQIAKVIETQNVDYPVGTLIVGRFGWRTHTISSGSTPTQLVWKIPDPEGLPLSYSLSILGRPGNTAYFGFLEICQPKPGETVVVTGAAGAVGSIVGQIAKIKGCTVIGIAGSDAKGHWLRDELNFDHFINYHDENFERKLIELTPKGVDCYFDNVGGEISTLIVSRMNLFGRISACGSISGYNDKTPTKITPINRYVVGQQLKMEGFIVTRWLDRWFEGIQQHKQWLKEGNLKYRETTTEGFENMFEAFVDMLKGKNFGKAIVKV